MDASPARAKLHVGATAVAIASKSGVIWVCLGWHELNCTAGAAQCCKSTIDLCWWQLAWSRICTHSWV